MHVRTATVEDALAVETVRLRGWQATYRGIVPDSYLDRMAVDARRRAEILGRRDVTTLVAVDPDVVGMAAYGRSRDGEDSVELYALYVEPRRAGIGSALMAACEGVTVVWVLEGNVGAQAFYRRQGFAADGGRKVLDLDGPVPEIRMRRG